MIEDQVTGYLCFRNEKRGPRDGIKQKPRLFLRGALFSRGFGREQKGHFGLVVVSLPALERQQAEKAGE